MEALYEIASKHGLQITSTFDGKAAFIKRLWFVEMLTQDHDALAQGYGRTQEEAAANCLADWFN